MYDFILSGYISIGHKDRTEHPVVASAGVREPDHDHRGPPPVNHHTREHDHGDGRGGNHGEGNVREMFYYIPENKI